MRDVAWTLVLRSLRAALLLAAAAYVVAFLWMAVQRVRYPFELEFMEGTFVDSIQRILDGRDLYVEPTLDFAPYIYSPLYFFLSAALAKLTGVGFLPLRLISVAGTLGSFVLIYAIVKRETGDRFAGALASGLFAACFEIGGAFFDIARTDALFVCSMLGSILLARRASSPASAALAGLAFAVSFLVKQLAGPVAIAVFLALVIWDLRRGLVFLATFAGVLGVVTLAWTAATDGWFWHYVFALNIGRAILPFMLVKYVHVDLAKLAGAILLGTFFLCARFSWRRDLREGSFWLIVSGGILAACGISRALSLGAFTNVLIPAHAILAVLFGLGAAEVLRAIRQASAVSPSWQALFLPFFLVAGGQLASLAFKPRAQVPTRADAAAGWELVELMRSVDGEVLLPAHGWLPRLAGKASGIHLVALRDAMTVQPDRNRLKEALIAGLRAHRWAAVVLDTDWRSEPWFMQEVERSYRVEVDEIFSSGVVFWPVTGSRLRPRKLFVPRE